jgi:hypothetical protein
MSASVESLITVAKLIGIDPVTESESLWIAQLACAEKADPEWKEFTADDGRIMYLNRRTQKLQHIHPVVDKYAQLYGKQKTFSKALLLSSAVEDDDKNERFVALLKTIYDRCHRNLPPATPAIIEQLSALLLIDPAKEHALVKCIKLTLEAYVQKQYDLSTFISDLHEALKKLRVTKKQYVKDDLIRKPQSVVMCQECEAKSAVLKCEQCLDFFCQDCYNATHATGNRRGHITQDVEQLVCSACDSKIAACQCVQCGSFFCDSCYVSTHSSRPELHNHLKRVISGLVCQECEHFNAAVLCEDCVDLFCTECYIKLHKKGGRRNHVHRTIDHTGQVFRSGFLVPPEEAQILIERSRTTIESGPWVPFKDDANRAFWHNFALNHSSYSAPTDDSVGATMSPTDISLTVANGLMSSDSAQQMPQLS